MKHSDSIKLTYRILTGMVLGIIVGLILKFVNVPFLNTYLISGLFALMAHILVVTLKMMVVPVVLVSLVLGVASMSSIKQLGRVGGKIVLLYLITTALAITISLVIAWLLHAGAGLHMNVATNMTMKKAPSLAQVIMNIFPSNPFKAMVDGQMLQIIFFALLLGSALMILKNKVPMIYTFFQEANSVIMRMLMLLLGYAPYGVFAIMAMVFAQTGFQAFISLFSYAGSLILSLLVQMFIIYGLLITLVGRLKYTTFYKKMWNVWVMAFSTDSSNATIPVNLRNTEENLGVDNSVASFTIPFGATVNMDGTAMMQGTATIAIAAMYGIHLTFTQLMTVVFMATIASIGTAGVPGVGLITLAMVLQQVGLPIQGIAVIMGIDRLLDMLRTTVNVTGDAACTLLVAKSEKQFNKEIFDN